MSSHRPQAYPYPPHFHTYSIATCAHTRGTSTLVPGGQSSPATLQSGQQVSKAIRQMPQQSSFMSHFHTPTACTFLMVTFWTSQKEVRGTCTSQLHAVCNCRNNTHHHKFLGGWDLLGLGRFCSSNSTMTTVQASPAEEAPAPPPPPTLWEACCSCDFERVKEICEGSELVDLDQPDNVGGVRGVCGLLGLGEEEEVWAQRLVRGLPGVASAPQVRVCSHRHALTASKRHQC